MPAAPGRAVSMHIKAQRKSPQEDLSSFSAQNQCHTGRCSRTCRIFDSASSSTPSSEVTMPGEKAFSSDTVKYLIVAGPEMVTTAGNGNTCLGNLMMPTSSGMNAVSLRKSSAGAGRIAWKMVTALASSAISTLLTQPSATGGLQLVAASCTKLPSDQPLRSNLTLTDSSTWNSHAINRPDSGSPPPHPTRTASILRQKHCQASILFNVLCMASDNTFSETKGQNLQN